MSRTHLVEIGTIKRIHGISGEVQVFWLPNGIPKEKDLTESVFIEIDGIPVPFFIASIRGNHTDFAILKFDEVDSPEAAEEFTGAKLFANLPDAHEREELFLDDLVGYSIENEQGKLVGEIIALEEYATNALFVVKAPNGQEIMLPAAPELIVNINEEAKMLTLQVPEGLLDMYLG